MLHPNPQIQKEQAAFLENCPADQREFHARLFRIGNAAIAYHQIADNSNTVLLEIYYREWLEGLPQNIREAMEKKGFENCKSMLPFTRYVNERNDQGMDEYMKNALSPDDYCYYLNDKN